jgi:hypothetical protein
VFVKKRGGKISWDYILLCDLIMFCIK